MHSQIQNKQLLCGLLKPKKSSLTLDQYHYENHRNKMFVLTMLASFPKNTHILISLTSVVWHCKMKVKSLFSTRRCLVLCAGLIAFTVLLQYGIVIFISVYKRENCFKILRGIGHQSKLGKHCDLLGFRRLMLIRNRYRPSEIFIALQAVCVS